MESVTIGVRRLVKFFVNWTPLTPRISSQELLVLEADVAVWVRGEHGLLSFSSNKLGLSDLVLCLLTYAESQCRAFRSGRICGCVVHDFVMQGSRFLMAAEHLG